VAYRVITDDVPVSTSLNHLTDFGERLYMRMLSQTDTWGRLSGELVKIRDLCLPRLAKTDSEINLALEELVRAGRITLYCVDGVWACQLVDFDRHQPIARLKRAPSRWPAPPQTDRQEVPAKSVIDKDRRQETEEKRLSGSPTAEASCVDLPEQKPATTPAGTAETERLRFHQHDLCALSVGLRGADAGTPFALASVLQGLPEAALARALEGLDRRRSRLPRLNSEARWLVGTITNMRREGQYA
jgi:hypothetical protein